MTHTNIVREIMRFILILCAFGITDVGMFVCNWSNFVKFDFT
jgi:hypothetical protein